MYANPQLFQQCKCTLQKLRRSRSKKNAGLILSNGCYYQMGIQHEAVHTRIPYSNQGKKLTIQKTQKLLDKKLSQNHHLVFNEPMDIEQSCKSVLLFKRDLSTDYSSSAKSQKLPINLMKIDVQKHQHIHIYLQDIKNFYLTKENYNFVYESYMSWHSEINIKMREVLVDWLIFIHYKLNLSESTLHLAIKLIDRFCFSKPIQKYRYQLLGVASLYIASKYIEVYPPRGRNFIQLCGGAYKEADIFEMESQILNCIDFTIIHSVNLWSMIELKLFQQGFFPEKQEKVMSYIVNSENKYSNSTETKRNRLLLDLVTILSEMSIIQYHLTLSKPNALSCCILYYAIKLWYKNNKENYLQDDIKLSPKQILKKYGLKAEQFKQQYDKVLTIWKDRRNKKFKSILLKFSYLFNQKGDLNFN